MSHLWETDWEKLFTLQMSLPEIFVRGTVGYLTVVLLLRLVLRRQPGRLSISDLLVVMIVAGVAKNPLVGGASSVLDGLLVIGVILFWSVAIDWLAFHLQFIGGIVHVEPVMLVKEGAIQADNLKKELMTVEQLEAKLREKGVGDVSQVGEARMGNCIPCR